MKAQELAALGAGFQDLALEGQRVFRAALEVLSRPGRIAEVASGAEAPRGLDPAACALALALLDHDTRLWASPSMSSVAAAYLRFHTGCTLVEDAAAGEFVLCRGCELPALASLATGSAEFPDRSSTCLVQVDHLADGGGWTLRGPGIREQAQLAIGGLPPDFHTQWNANGALYPRGVDLFLACGRRLCGLPRTTRLEVGCT